jgi:hypothetical protein
MGPDGTDEDQLRIQNGKLKIEEGSKRGWTGMDIDGRAEIEVSFRFFYRWVYGVFA